MRDGNHKVWEYKKIHGKSPKEIFLGKAEIRQLNKLKEIGAVSFDTEENRRPVIFGIHISLVPYHSYLEVS
jgi:hypothetical protein